MGKAMSCGAILLSHGDIRYCGPNSRVMIHEVSGASWGDVHDVHNDAVETVRLNEHFLGLLAANCGIKNGYKGLRKLIKDRDGRDIWLDAKAAHAFGIVDYVGIPRIVKLTQYTSTLPTDEESPQERRKRFAKLIKEAKE
jgi:ATP-dependent Clp protease protease subunit